MTVQQLIDKLKDLPSDAHVMCIWDGEPRTSIDVCYLSKSGHVMLCDDSSYTYSYSATPLYSDTQSDKIVFDLPEKEPSVVTIDFSETNP